MHLLYPQICFGCGTDEVEKNMPLCPNCIQDLPFTDFFGINENPVEKIFWGRANVQNAGTLFFFTKDSLIQKLITELKYHHNKKVGVLFGKLMGDAIAVEEKFKQIDLIIPIPIKGAKINSRGYNQSEYIAKGLVKSLNKPQYTNILKRKIQRKSQTHLNKFTRWQNMNESFELKSALPSDIKHILLVDDVITTGATLESCANAIHQEHQVKISIASIAFAPLQA